MEYKDLIKNAKANGVASDKAMWQSVDGKGSATKTWDYICCKNKM